MTQDYAEYYWFLELPQSKGWQLKRFPKLKYYLQEYKKLKGMVYIECPSKIFLGMDTFTKSNDNLIFITQQ